MSMALFASLTMLPGLAAKGQAIGAQVSSNVSGEMTQKLKEALALHRPFMGQGPRAGCGSGGLGRVQILVHRCTSPVRSQETECLPGAPCLLPWMGSSHHSETLILNSHCQVYFLKVGVMLFILFLILKRKKTKQKYEKNK